MEQNPETPIIPTIPKPPPPHHHHDDEPEPEPKPKPKRKPIQIQPRKRNYGPMHLISVALFMMRGHSKKSSVLPVDDGHVLRKLVGSMRPLHLQGNQLSRSFSLPNVILLPSNSPCEPVGGGGAVEEEPINSPSPPSSRYASAIGLSELVHESDEEIEKVQDVIMEEEISDKKGEDGDDKIDAKADEFIAQFYKQMKLQRMNNIVNRRYQERSERSLGW